MSEAAALLSRLSQLTSPAAAQQAWETIQRRSEQQIERWESGVPPLPFDEFCATVGPPLKERQRAAMAAAGMLDPNALLDDTRAVQELVLCYGKGSGKDWLAARLVAWATYICLSLKGSPAAHFGLDPKTELHVLNTAPNEDSARNIFFRPYLKPIIEHEIFRPWIPDPKGQILTDEIRFPQKRIALYSMHSRASGLDGYNTILWVMDEADDFLDSNKKSLAEAVHGVLRSSANTRFNGRYWCGIVISYPRTEVGFMMRLVERAKADPTFYWDLAATWEVRPEVSRDSPGIASDYANDPREAAARYECRPMPSEDTFIEFPEFITQAMGTHASLAEWDEHISTIRLDNGEQAEYVGVQLQSLQTVPGREYFLGGDGAVSGDSFTLSLMHLETGGQAASWLCPRCGGLGTDRDDEMQKILRQGADYRRLPKGHLVPFEGAVQCGICWLEVPRVGQRGESLHVGGWWRNQAHEQPIPMTVDGQTVVVPRIVEDLLIEFRPQHAERPGQRNRPVDLEGETFGVKGVCQTLFESLPIRKASFDPSHAVGLVQWLKRKGYPADTILFTTPHQYRRARLMKALLYAGAIRLLPVSAGMTEPMRRCLEARDLEWKRLQRTGQKIDHPAGGRKDCWDSETVAAFEAAQVAVPDLVRSFEEEERKAA